MGAVPMHFKGLRSFHSDQVCTLWRGVGTRFPALEIVRGFPIYGAWGRYPDNLQESFHG
jgi:hypothetical protein